MGLNALMKFFNLDMDQEYDYEEDFDSIPSENDYEPTERSKRNRSSRAAEMEDEPKKQKNSFLSPKPKVMPMNKPNYEVKVFRPSSFDDCWKICDSLLEANPVIVNLQGFDSEEAQRIMDFVSGCLYAINGTFSDISKSTYIFAPENVDIIGDVSENENNEVMHTVDVDY